MKSLSLTPSPQPDDPVRPKPQPKNQFPTGRLDVSTRTVLYISLCVLVARSCSETEYLLSTQMQVAEMCRAQLWVSVQSATTLSLQESLSHFIVTTMLTASFPCMILHRRNLACIGCGCPRSGNAEIGRAHV